MVSISLNKICDSMWPMRVGVSWNGDKDVVILISRETKAMPLQREV